MKSCNNVLKKSLEEAFNPYLKALYGSYHVQAKTVEQIVPNKIPDTPKSKIAKKYSERIIFNIISARFFYFAHNLSHKLKSTLESVFYKKLGKNEGRSKSQSYN